MQGEVYPSIRIKIYTFGLLKATLGIFPGGAYYLFPDNEYLACLQISQH
jgi:hypothetical protein